MSVFFSKWLFVVKNECCILSDDLVCFKGSSENLLAMFEFFSKMFPQTFFFLPYLGFARLHVNENTAADWMRSWSPPPLLPLPPTLLWEPWVTVAALNLPGAAALQDTRSSSRKPRKKTNDTIM